MADDEPVRAPQAGRAQKRRDDAAAGVRGLGEARAGVVDERVAVRFDDGGEPLPDVEHRQAERAGRRRLRPHDE